MFLITVFLISLVVIKLNTTNVNETVSYAVYHKLKELIYCFSDRIHERLRTV